MPVMDCLDDSGGACSQCFRSKKVHARLAACGSSLSAGPSAGPHGSPWALYSEPLALHTLSPRLSVLRSLKLSIPSPWLSIPSPTVEGIHRATLWRILIGFGTSWFECAYRVSTPSAPTVKAVPNVLPLIDVPSKERTGMIPQQKPVLRLSRNSTRLLVRLFIRL